MEGRQLQQVLNTQRLKSLQEWMQKSSITLTQVNGQRKYGGPPPGKYSFFVFSAFKKHYGISITVKWTSFSKSKHVSETGQEDGTFTPPGLSPLPKPSITPPHLHPQPSLQDVPAHPSLQSFFRAVGGPAGPPRDEMKPQGPVNRDAVSLLQWMCEVNRLGTPQYEVRFHHASSDGFLCFSYEVLIPCFLIPLYGVIQILPGPSVQATKKEVYRAVAELVIQTICKVSNARPF
ncbi:dead end protein 1-like [Sinocyclocheilus anshuiensis]|uniref:dead end protein 1-like n=1 Tax=Sinocyclocheilus anshuiensis TaxID=1608454 RepID=UPI0007B8A597|nr:PREDICTED: dead end protein 1-like [Sinocyclocheilus anshuiensis]